MSSTFSRALLPAGSGPELAAAVTAEAIGTALLQLVSGAGRAATVSSSSSFSGPLVSVLIFASSFAAISSSTRPASGGHLNPSISLAATLGGRLAAASFLAYVAAQFLGAVVGGMVSGMTVPGARLFAKARAVGCLVHPSTRGSYGANWWRLFAWEGVSSAAASLALLSHSSPAIVALAFASVGAAAAVATAGDASTPLGDVVGNPALVLGPAVSFGCGWKAAPARWAGQALGATVAAALAVAVLPPISRVRVAPTATPTATRTTSVPQATTTATTGTRRGGGGGVQAAEPGSSSVREPLLPTTTATTGPTTAPGGDV